MALMFQGIIEVNSMDDRFTVSEVLLVWLSNLLNL